MDFLVNKMHSIGINREKGEGEREITITHQKVEWKHGDAGTENVGKVMEQNQTVSQQRRRYLFEKIVFQRHLKKE